MELGSLSAHRPKYLSWPTTSKPQNPYKPRSKNPLTAVLPAWVARKAPDWVYLNCDIASSAQWRTPGDAKKITSAPRRVSCMIEASISVGDPESLVLILGTKDQHLKQIREAIPATFSVKDGNIFIHGEEQAVIKATTVLEELRTMLRRNLPIDPDQVQQVIRRATSGEKIPTAEPISVRGGKQIHARTRGQAEYLKTIRDNDLVFCTGPAGTGKTYLAVATAVEALRAHRVRKLVLVRPAVEAGESLGFLPGDLREKINPYLRPLLDALGDMMDRDQVQRYMAEDVIEVVPLAYMRGRTLNSAFIIMDEAQNTTVAQMKMFLTRMGEGSKIVVSGDTTQIDLPPHTKSGLIDALSRLRDIEGFAKVHLSTEDIVRHRLVQDIVRAYEEGSKKKR
jgi:phosphate starvation-inducible PhoH-like protein